MAAVCTSSYQRVSICAALFATRPISVSHHFGDQQCRQTDNVRQQRRPTVSADITQK